MPYRALDEGNLKGYYYNENECITNIQQRLHLALIPACGSSSFRSYHDSHSSIASLETRTEVLPCIPM
ncbi:hypothetical protein EGI32_02505 [Ferruginibacter sp. HRS2-29]|nr:hypothetical protein [Ferruginibacter sp. HRS2-29]